MNLRKASRTSLLLVLLMPLNAHYAAPELKGSPAELKGFLYPNDNTVHIHAEAERKAYADTALVSLLVKTEAKKLSSAMAQNNAIQQQIKNTLSAKGIAEDAINTSKFSTTPEFAWFGQTPSNYNVNNRMVISISASEQLQAITALVDEFDEVALAHMAFEHSQKEAEKTAVKAEAMAKVLKQKQFYEQQLGIKLQAIAINDSRVFAQATMGAKQYDRKRLKQAPMAESMAVDMASKPQPAPKTFDELNYRADISVTFKIVK